MFKLQGYYHSAATGFAKLVINKSIRNHPLEKFANKDKEEVMVLVEALGTKQHVHVIEVIVLEKHIV